MCLKVSEEKEVQLLTINEVAGQEAWNIRFVVDKKKFRSVEDKNEDLDKVIHFSFQVQKQNTYNQLHNLHKILGLKWKLLNFSLLFGNGAVEVAPMEIDPLEEVHDSENITDVAPVVESVSIFGKINEQIEEF